MGTEQMIMHELPDDALIRVINDVIRQRIRRFPPGWDAEDMSQEVLAEIIRAWPRYDPSRGTPASFCHRVAHSKLISIARKWHAQKRRPPQAIVSLDEYVGDSDGRQCPLRETVPARPHGRDRDLEYDVHDLIGDLPPSSQRLANDLMNGKSRHASRQRAEISRDQLVIDEDELRTAFIARGFNEITD
ncbi:MAG: hypothetical protein HND57_02115 [Planctomycetes bacterium]|nr:hypothetical protein [Planctomycetota bacterium]